MGKTSIVFGATGLIGAHLVTELIRSKRYSVIKIFTRKSTGLEHINLDEKVVDVENIESYSNMISGDDLFICIGTTLKKARSVKRIEEIDRDLPLKIAKTARKNGVKKIAVVCSIGANSRSRGYYMRIKGEMENGIRELKFDRSVIARPSMLLGKRKEFRISDLFGQFFAGTLGFILIGPFRNLRGIHGRDVATSMISLINTESTQLVYQSDELRKVAGRSEKITGAENQD